MGIEDRKQRHKDDLKETILKAAKALFVEKGFEATSMRNIAERIEYSAATIYLHFKDKSEVFFALHQEGFQMLVDEMRTLSVVEDPFERLKAMGHIYVKFAEENPDFYQLMFVMKEPLMFIDTADDKCWEEGQDAFKFLQDTVNECQQRGIFAGIEPNGLSLAIWSTVHGLASLRTSGHLEHVRQVKLKSAELDNITQHTLETFITMLSRLR